MTYDTINDAVTMQGGDASALGRIDKYELVRELGEGGFGTVYLAHDTVAKTDVAVKGLPPEVKHNESELESIRGNFALVKRLRHPNIVAVTDLHQALSVSYASKEVESKLRVFERDTMVVMDYAPGVTLAKWRRQFPGGKVPLDKAIAVVRQVASALDYAHGQKVLHRDVKPANIMVEAVDGGSLTARVLDFGLAAEIRSSMGRLSREIRDTSGTRPYMAPEQWKGERQGPATDQYALAAMFYELVVGEVPFASVFDCGDPAVMRLAVTTDAPAIPADLPKCVRRALAVALAKNLEERFASCGEFVAALEGKKVSRRGAETQRKSGLGKVFGILALLAALAGGGYFGWVKYDEGVRAREAEEARAASEKAAEAARIKQEVYELKGKASQAREKNEKEEWHSWPHFEEKAKELEGAFRAGESAFEKDDYAAARELFLKVRDNWRWLSSNKVERACAVAAKDQAEEGWRKADAAEAGKLAADAYLEASNVLSRAAQAFDSGDFGAANAGFKKADSLFAHAASRASDVRIAAGRAKMEAERKKAESELDREEAETVARISTLRKEMNDALSVQDDVTALAKAGMLVELSLDARDAKEWVDMYLRLAEKESNLFARLQMTESIRDILDKGHAWRVDVETMRRTDLADPAVLNMFGKFLSTDSHGFKRNPALAREFFSRSLAGGFKDAEEGFNQRDEEIRQKPYFDAASSGNIAKVRRVFTKEHPHADIVDRNGRTPMFAAARNGDAEILDYMDSLGFKLDAQDKKGEVPFFSACASTNAAKALSAVKWFVEKKGFDCNWRNSSTNRYATMNGLFNVRRLDVFEYLISKGAKPDVRNNQGQTILHRYISEGCDRALVEAAIKAGVDVEDEDDGGEQPIHCAAHGDGDEADKVVLLLLRRGVDVNARVRKGKKKAYWESYTPLHVACAAWHADAKIGNRIKTIRALLANGADLKAVTSAGAFEGRTPLLMAADRCDVQVLELLLDAGADVNARVGEGIFQGRMAIHLAASAAENTNCVPALQILLSHGANIKSKVVGSSYQEGQTPLHCAIGRVDSGLDPIKAKSFYAAMRFMLESGGDVNQEAKKERFRITTPLGEACEGADAGIVSFLLEHGAKKSLGLASTDGWSLLHIVANRRDRDKRKCDAHERIIGLLVQAGMDVDGRIGGGVYKGYTPLHFAAQAKNVHAIRALIANGADVNARSARLETPLMILAEQTKEENLEECISCLLMFGADANIPDKNGKTPRERAKTSVASRLLSVPWKKNTSVVEVHTKAALEAFRRSSCDGKAALSAGYRLAQNADENDPNIQLYLAGCYAEGLPLPASGGRTLSWYRDRARNGDANAQFLYGTLLGNGKGVPRDEKAANQLLEQSAKNGNAAAQAMYGILMCEKEHKYQEGMRWLRQSADSGVDLAEAMTAKYLAQGQNGIKRDVAEARRLGLKLLAKGFWLAPQR